MSWIAQHAELIFCIVGCMLVTAIPRMYILDRNGKIIAQDLRGEELAKKMDEIFADAQ